MDLPERRGDGTCTVCWRPFGYSCCHTTHLYQEAAHLSDGELLAEIQRLRDNPRTHWVHKRIDSAKINAFEDHLFGRIRQDNSDSELAQFMENLLKKRETQI